MRPFFRRCLVVLAVTSSFGASGCESLDFLHPSNTWKLNRGPAMDEGDAYFSISDTAATELSHEK